MEGKLSHLGGVPFFGEISGFVPSARKKFDPQILSVVGNPPLKLSVLRNAGSLKVGLMAGDQERIWVLRVPPEGEIASERLIPLRGSQGSLNGGKTIPQYDSRYTASFARRPQCRQGVGRAILKEKPSLSSLLFPER